MFFIEEEISLDYKSNLFELFTEEIQSEIPVSASFLKYSSEIFPIFTKINQYIINFIKTKNIKKYGIVIDSKNLQKDLSIEILINALFVYVVGEIDDKNKNFFNKINVRFINRIIVSRQFKEKKYILCENSYIQQLYENIVSEKESINNDKIYLIDNNITNYKRNLFEIFNIDVEYIVPTPNMFLYLLSNYKQIYYTSKLFDYYTNKDSNFITYKEFIGEIKQCLKKYNICEYEINKQKIINIICFKPTYLFKDLVNRFINIGCIHSDFPLSNADAYIWMRPQEIWHYSYLVQGVNDKEIKDSYITEFKKLNNKCDIDLLLKKSIAIHHGTCFQPLYQFCPNKLADYLYNIYKVIGVCEFDECYGPSIHLANKNNFEFCPIGYDDKIFIENFINVKTRHSKDIIKIGIVGRAYGTIDKKVLSNSILAEPYGYRKGSDLILDIALKLKTLNINFEFHILGANWEYLINYLNKYNINYMYYTRDKDITYKDYPKIYSKFDMLLIAARCEGGPVSAIEAMSVGIPIVSSNVGICKFLEKKFKNNNFIYCFDYDRKWGIFDSETAVNYILDIYNKEDSFENRIKRRNAIKQYTTDNWVNFIYQKANELLK